MVCRLSELFGSQGNPSGIQLSAEKEVFRTLEHYYWEEPILYKHCANQVIRRCVPKDEMHTTATLYHVEDILVTREQQPRCFNQASTSLAYSRMLISSYPHVINVNEWGAFLERTNRPCIQFWK